MYTKMSTKGCNTPRRVPARGTPCGYPALCSCSLPRLLRFRACPEEEANGCALEAECLTQLIFQVAFVGEMQRLWVVDEKDESRWVHLRLRRIVDLQYLPTEHGRVMATNGIPNDLVETRGGDAQVSHIGDAQRRLEQRLYVIARGR